jgi:hypothetical protein
LGVAYCKKRVRVMTKTSTHKYNPRLDRIDDQDGKLKFAATRQYCKLYHEEGKLQLKLSISTTLIEMLYLAVVVCVCPMNN